MPEMTPKMIEIRTKAQAYLKHKGITYNITMIEVWNAVNAIKHGKGIMTAIKDEKVAEALLYAIAHTK